MKNKINVGLLYILPWILGILLLKIFPFGLSLFLSFTRYDLISSPQFIGIENYVEMFKDELFIKSLLNTIKYVIVTVPLKLAFALFIASILNFKIKGVGIFRTAYYLPSILGGSVAISVLWRFLFADNGLVNIMLKMLHLPTASWMGDQKYALFTIGLLSVWQFGSSMVIFLAALKNIPNTLYEAARIDGANAWQVFRHITLPHIKVVIGLLVVLRTVWVFNNFDIIYLITGGGPANSTMTLPIYAYNMGWGTKLLGRSSAVTVLLFIFLLLICFIYFKVISRWEKEGE